MYRNIYSHVRDDEAVSTREEDLVGSGGDGSVGGLGDDLRDINLLPNNLKIILKVGDEVGINDQHCFLNQLITN